MNLWSRIQYAACLAAVIGVLYYLATQGNPPTVGIPVDTDRDAAVRVVAPKRIAISPDSPLAKKLQIATVASSEITSPLLTVTGVVAASLHPDNGKGSDYWQFHSPDLLTAYTDWQKAVTDLAFLEEQLVDTKQLAESQVDAAQKLVERMQRLVTIGTDTEKDLAEARADLIQAQIQGRKDVHEAETAVRMAKQEEAALARQLEQAGLDPALLAAADSDVDIVTADVPESWVGRVAIGQSCVAHFLSLSEEQFTGCVHAIVPVLSAERRSLRVLLSIYDPEFKLRPGMFAEIGIGTDPRQSLLAPADAIIHIGRSDYVVVREDEAVWQVTEVKVGELRNQLVEIPEGLEDGRQVVGHGAILLKPSMIKSLQMNTTP
ncbi:MAG: efflux RND transporter periplasmic adaptor subunit [Planctomycetaceae bacterium]|nr:efflux RND transporter periplasmic adaptor subunit [Planctomycetaceae bacterium]